MITIIIPGWFYSILALVLAVYAADKAMDIVMKILRRRNEKQFRVHIQKALEPMINQDKNVQ